MSEMAQEQHRNKSQIIAHSVTNSPSHNMPNLALNLNELKEENES